MSKRVLVVAPHPDDETLGCGGTLLKHKAGRDKIYWLIMTNISTENGWAKKKVEKRQTEIEQVSSLYGFAETFKLDFPTTKLDAVPYGEIIARTNEVIKKVKPQIVYLPNGSDIHTDHQKTFQTVMSCCKDFRAPFINKILSYECLSETEFAPRRKDNFFPNVFVDISPFFDKKVAIFKKYRSEIMPSPLPRSIDTVRSLAKLRGSRIGKKYGEAFCSLFEKM